MKQNEQTDIDVYTMEKLNTENEDDVLSEFTSAYLVLVDSEVMNHQEIAATKPMATTAVRKLESRGNSTKERRSGNKEKDGKRAANTLQKSRAKHATVCSRAMTSAERTRKCRAKQAKEEKVREKNHQAITPVANLQFKQKEQTKDDIVIDDIIFDDIEGLGIESEEDVLLEVLTMIEGNQMRIHRCRKENIRARDVVVTEELSNFGFGEHEFHDAT